ncbi:MAG: AraC family transcriptional regulator [Treponema sp.]|jgi:AraC-like DNA-binding protein|nr:AraC family transcriptional regulator [Treponema sp.]
MYKYKTFKADSLYLWEVHSDAEAFEGRISHCHKECEILYMIDGEAEFKIEGKQFLLNSDSMLLIPPDCLHHWHFSADEISHRISVHFLMELLDGAEQDFFGGLLSRPMHFRGRSQNNLSFFFQAVVDCLNMPEPLKYIAAKHRLSALLSQLYFMNQTSAAQPLVVDKRIQAIVDFIGKNFREDISLDGIAAKFNISKNHLNTLFNNEVGTTIMKYLAGKRLDCARHAIADGVHVSDAAYDAGFHDYTTFFRAYKSFYGRPPSDSVTGPGGE